MGIVNFFFGIPIFLLALCFALFVLPKLGLLYSEFNANTSGNMSASYLSVFILIAISVVNIFLGLKGFSKTQKKETYFKYGLISAIATFLISGTVIGYMVLSAILPVYSLTS
jgi:hypothetical protein